MIDTGGSGLLGTTVSSARYKDNIQDLKTENNPVLQFRPVTFTYKEDENKNYQTGLIAEEVFEIFPELVFFNKAGEPETIKYHLLDFMLLQIIQTQQETIQEMQKHLDRIEALLEL